MMRRAFQAVVLVGVLALTSGCSLIDRAGAAAVVDGQRYTNDQLASDFVALDHELGNASKPGTMDQINLNFINIFVSHEVALRAASELGLEVDAAAVQKVRYGIEGQLGGWQKTKAYAASKGIAPSLLDDLFVDSAIMAAIGKKLAPTADATTQSNMASAYLGSVVKKMSIEVAPRYGAWDAKNLTVAANASDLSTSVTAAG